MPTPSITVTESGTVQTIILAPTVTRGITPAVGVALAGDNITITLTP
jgi:hypothetical protein